MTFAVVLAAAFGLSPVQPGEPVTALPPEQAAGQALMSCVGHVMGMAPIIEANRQALAATGLVYSEQLPPFLRAQARNEFGQASFAQAPSADGQIWVAGYDTGACIVTAIGTPEGPVVQRLEHLFAIPGSWKREKIKQLPGARWSQYGWKSPQANLTAQMSIRDLPADSPAKGFVSVTIVPKPKDKK